MNENKRFSILSPQCGNREYKQLSETACHDLGLDMICRQITDNQKEQNLIIGILSNMTADPEAAVYRQKVFVDILRHPDLRKRLTELFDRLEFIRSFSSIHKESEEKLGLWHLLHRLDELHDYIQCVEAMQNCLSEAELRSEGLLGFRNFIDELYHEACFAEMKKDIAELKKKSSSIQSVTLGINVNERFEAISMGLISVNNKPFRKSGIVSNFADALSSRNRIHEGTEWNGDMHYHQIEKQQDNALYAFIEKTAGISVAQSAPYIENRMVSTIVNTPDDDGASRTTFYLDNTLNKMLDSLVKKLRDTLTKYANIAIVNISHIIPEFIYYIRFAEFISAGMERGFRFCEAQLMENDDISMDAKDLYNLKLAVTMENKDEIVYNDLRFDNEHTVYILTGANRGGKTTITQAVGLLFVLAQGGIYVPASGFAYKPVDCIYTHFPADEDKTMDLGRLGEECVRFKDMYFDCTKDSLLLLNETFSTTSFEEGFYIAKDSVRALLKKQVRTIYNTHMHKLAADVDEINKESCGIKSSSLIMKNDGGKRSFKVEIARPEGMSYARDIAEKYGITYEMLTR